MITEADTCRKYVLKKLYSGGWTYEQINEQKTITKTKLDVLIPSILNKAFKWELWFNVKYHGKEHQHQIDQLVYKLYDLTEEEIAIVENINK